jgi:hypothetical protein
MAKAIQVLPVRIGSPPVSIAPSSINQPTSRKAMPSKFNPSQGTINLIVGIGLLLQFFSILIMFNLWKHHHHYLYVLPISVIGLILSIVTPLYFKSAELK